MSRDFLVGRPHDVVGLCATCSFARRVISALGSEFWRCQRADIDPAFRRYPALPVRECRGYDRLLTDHDPPSEV